MACTLANLMTTEDGRWRPGIGDPTVMGWLTVIAYFLAAYFAAKTVHTTWLRARWLRERQQPEALDGELRLMRLWTFIVAVLVFLGINKQLDLQTWLTQAARDASIEQGWYADRRRYQVLFVAAVALGGLCAAAYGAYLMRPVLRRAMGAIVGLAALVSFVAIRAASFHHMDALLGRHPLRLNWVLELGGIGIIAFAAHRARQEIRQPQTGP